MDRNRWLPFAYLLLLWPLAGVASATAGLLSAYWSGSWLLIPYMLLLVGGSVGLTAVLLNRLPLTPPDFVEWFTYAYLPLAALGGIFFGYLVGRPYLDLTRYPPLENVRVEEATDDLTPGYRQFRNGRLLPNYTATYTETGVDSDGYYYRYDYIVAPVVSPGWRESDPVTLWVVTGSQELTITDFAAWDKPIQGMVAVRQVGNYWRGVETAVSTHTLQTDPNALLLRLYEQNHADLTAKLWRDMGRYLLAITAVGWLPLLFMLWRKEF